MVEGPGSKIKPVVRATYAACLASLAHTSLKILDTVQALKADGSIPTVDPEAEVGAATNTLYQNLYDVARSGLVEHFESHTKALLTDRDPYVRRAFLGSVSSLCVFFGSPKANDVVLSHLNTYLNDKDWMLKCAFFQTIVGVATFVGGPSLEDFILPLMVQALTDPEEFVVEKVLSSFATIAELGMFQRSTTWEIVDVVARFMVHPNIWIREAAAQFVSSSTRLLSQADIHCIILPLIKPYLKTSLTDFSETTILDALRKPLPRPILEMAATWATKVERGLFWKPAHQQRTFSFGGPNQAIPTISSKDLSADSLRKVSKNDEDEQWLSRLRNLGMASEDELKLLALREYIGRMALKRPKEGNSSTTRFNSIVNLKELSITPQTVFFEDHEGKKQKNVSRRLSHGNFQTSGKTPHTLADALLDASSTINDPHRQRKKPQVSHPPRLNGEATTLSIPVGSHDSRRGPSNVPSPLSSSPSTRAASRNPTMPNVTPSTRTTSRIPTYLMSTDDARSDGTITPTGSIRQGGGLERLNGVKHKSSAINLLNRKDNSKTVAETSTDSTNVIGEMDVPTNPEVGNNASAALNGQVERRLGPLHTYEGKDPNIGRLMDDLAMENYPMDLNDFGPIVTPVSRKLLRKTDPQEVEMPWRLRGIHVATFGEHTGSINRVLPSPDHLFFITASNDGTVKIWDTSRLERNLIHRSRQTHKHADGVKVTGICFVENTHTFASCANDGSIHIVKVDCTPVGDTAKYGKLRVVRQYQLPEGEWAIWSEHFKSEAKSILLIATNISRIVALDLRTMTLLYSFSIPIHYGAPTCFVLDKKHHWILLGTSHGILSLCDLRFRLRIRSWSLAGNSRIHRLQIHPFKGRGRWVCIAGGTNHSEIIVWDLEKHICREAYRAAGSTDIPNPKTYEPIKIDDEKPESMLERFATALDPSSAGTADRGFRALAIGVDGTTDDRDAKYGFLLTGGTDRKLRFWDLARVETSVIVSGLEVDEPQPKYIATHPSASLTLNIERAPQAGPSAPNAGREGRGGEGERTKSNSSAKRRMEKAPRSAVMASQQRALLRSHLDVITDVCVLERPVGMTVSVDRRGCVYVFQ